MLYTLCKHIGSSYGYSNMAQRKLQSEIERTLKKVAEGVEYFEEIYDKMQGATTQTQKEKNESDLKTQIKKLQRMRDQIKTWVASNDIKDKSALLENRKLIETQMERFKACEKEMKTKAFSKEGLIQAAKLDPKEQEKEEAMQWVNHQVEELQMQVEQTEAELETMQGAGKKRKGTSGNPGRQEELERVNERRKWHISRLEIVLRMLNNGSLPVEKVNELKEDVTYFVESNAEENFDEDEGIYDELHLDEEEEKFGLVADDAESDNSDEVSEDAPPPSRSKKHDDDSASSKRDDSPLLKKASVSLRKQSLDTKPPPNINFAAQPMASVLKAGLQQTVLRPAAPTLGYAAIAAGAVTQQAVSSPSSSTLPGQTPVSAIVSQPPLNPPIAPSITTQLAGGPLPSEQQSAITTSPSLTQLSVTSPMLSSAASGSHQHDSSFYSGLDSPTLSESKAAPQSPSVLKDLTFSPVVTAPPATMVTSPMDMLPATQTQTNGSQAGLPLASAVGLSPLPQQLQQLSQTPKSPMPTQQPHPPPLPSGVKVEQQQPQQTGNVALLTTQQTVGSQRSSSTAQQVPQQRSAVPSAFPGSLSDLVVSFENVKQKALRANNLTQVHKMLEGGYSSIPQPQDTEKPRYYVPRNPFTTPAYYPQTPHPLLQTPGIFGQLDLETLFWVFYYLPGTYQQFLAAKELKRQSWRFHIKYLTWFQRHSEPQAITDEYEQGVYVYFDWENSWCQRKKSDFRFEYRYLSED